MSTAHRTRAGPRWAGRFGAHRDAAHWTPNTASRSMTPTGVYIPTEGAGPQIASGARVVRVN